MKNNGKKIADEVWIMLPDSCKEIMKGIKKPFKDSIEADVNDLFNETNTIKNQIKELIKEIEKVENFYLDKKGVLIKLIEIIKNK